MRHLESRHLVTERDRFLDERHLHMDVHAPPPRAEMGVARAFAAQLGEALPLLSVAGFGALLVWVALPGLLLGDCQLGGLPTEVSLQLARLGGRQVVPHPADGVLVQGLIWFRGP